jgi:hypothetical protein
MIYVIIPYKKMADKIQLCNNVIATTKLVVTKLRKISIVLLSSDEAVPVPKHHAMKEYRWSGEVKLKAFLT